MRRGNSRGDSDRNLEARGRRLHSAIRRMTDMYLREGGSVEDGLETFLTSFTTENIISKLGRQDSAAFEKLTSTCLSAAMQNVFTNVSLEKAFARMTLREFLRFESAILGEQPYLK